MATSSQNTGRHFIKAADRLEKKDQQDPGAGCTDHSRIIAEQVAEPFTENSQGNDNQRTEQDTEKETEQKNFPASVFFSGSEVLAGEGGCCLPKSGDHVIAEIFKIHGDRAPGSCDGAEAVDRSLYEDIGEAEYGSLHSRRDADRKHMEELFSVNAKISESHVKFFRFSVQPEQDKGCRKGCGDICGNGNTCNTEVADDNKKQVQKDV